MISIIKYSFFIFSCSISPFPTLPLIIISYYENGFLGGLISTLIGGGLASIVLYLFGFSSRNFLSYNRSKKL